MTEALKSEEVIHQGKFREYLISILLNEKEEATQKTMYAQISEVFKKNTQALSQAIEEKEAKLKSEDQQMAEVDTSSTKNKELIAALQLVISDIQLIQKVIGNSKPYFKEAIFKNSFFMESLNLLKNLHANFAGLFQQELIEDDSLNGIYQKTM
jgi:hypothetical protein